MNKLHVTENQKTDTEIWVEDGATGVRIDTTNPVDMMKEVVKNLDERVCYVRIIKDPLISNESQEKCCCNANCQKQSNDSIDRIERLQQSPRKKV